MKVSECWNQLLLKPEEARSVVESRIADVNGFLIDFENGSWLYNLSPQAGEADSWRKLRRVAAAAHALEIERIGAILDEIATLLEGAGNQKAASWGEFLRLADPGRRIPALKRAIDAEVPHAWERLESYTATHLNCEPDV
jgi:hypothetical protein